jgi:hypothetical protein
MIPCSACHRHLRESEPACPFCGATQRSIASASVLLVAVAMLGSACTRDPIDLDDEAADEASTSESTTTTDESGTDTSSSTDTDTDDTTNDTWDSGLSFYALPADVGPIEECDPFAQDCPDGEKCVPYASSGGVWDANKCVPVTGDGAPGDPCTWGGIVEATDDCGADSICWDVMDVDGQLIGVCTPLCPGTADMPECDPGSSCLIAYDGSVTLCLADCDPLAQECGDGLGCFWDGYGFHCIFTTDDIPTGEPCSYINDCAPGNLCADAAALPACDGQACCAAYCELSDPVCAVMGTECIAFFEEGLAPLGYENLGVCAIP